MTTKELHLYSARLMLLHYFITSILFSLSSCSGKLTQKHVSRLLTTFLHFCICASILKTCLQPKLFLSVGYLTMDPVRQRFWQTSGKTFLTNTQQNNFDKPPAKIFWHWHSPSARLKASRYVLPPSHDDGRYGIHYGSFQAWNMGQLMLLHPQPQSSAGSIKARQRRLWKPLAAIFLKSLPPCILPAISQAPFFGPLWILAAA